MTAVRPGRHVEQGRIPAGEPVGLSAHRLAWRGLLAGRAPALVLALLAAVTAAYLVATPRVQSVAADEAVGDAVAAARAQARELSLLAPAAQAYDVNVLSTQRVNRAALPHLRAQRDGLVVWIGSSSTRGGTPPYLAPYFAAKAAMDSLAVSYAAELARFGVDTSIVVPGSFTVGTNHFANAGGPSDAVRDKAYEEPYGELRAGLTDRLNRLIPPDARAESVAGEIVRIVGLPAGRRPFRSHVDPSRDGSEVVSIVADRIRAEFYHRVGIEDLLSSTASL